MTKTDKALERTKAPNIESARGALFRERGGQTGPAPWKPSKRAKAKRPRKDKS